MDKNDLIILGIVAGVIVLFVAFLVFVMVSRNKKMDTSHPWMDLKDSRIEYQWTSGINMVAIVAIVAAATIFIVTMALLDDESVSQDLLRALEQVLDDLETRP